MNFIKSFLSLAMIFAALTFSYAQDANDGETGKAKKSATSRGQDPNIKSDEAVNIKGKTDQKAIQPGEKGGEARGGSCYTYFKNFTPWRITCYVDGYREGTVGPYGDGGVYVESGSTTMYSVAYFDDGSTISWGPGTKYCGYADDMVMEVYNESYLLYVD